MIAGGNWWRANEIVIRYHIRQTDPRQGRVTRPVEHHATAAHNLRAQFRFVYDSDVYSDDLPYYVDVGAKKHLVIPYSMTYNDAKFSLPPSVGWPCDFLDNLASAPDWTSQLNSRAARVSGICGGEGPPGASTLRAGGTSITPRSQSEAWVTCIRVRACTHQLASWPRPNGSGRLARPFSRRFPPSSPPSTS